MKHILLSVVFGSFFMHAQSQNAEKLIKNFWAGFEQKDWNLVASQLSADFTFTSPNDDDHITLAQYKEKCWSAALKISQHIEFQKIVVDGNTAFVMYNITATNSKPVHNVEYYTFSNGKIKSIETFFGVGVGYPGNSHKVK